MDLIEYTKNTNLKTITQESLKEITEWMPECNRAMSAFGKQNSQTTLSLMTMNMLDSGPYRVLRQILAQVEKKRSALNEAIYKLKLKQIKKKEYINLYELSTDLDAERLKLKIEKIDTDAAISQTYIEGAIKGIGVLKRMYEEVCKNHNIPDNWDEQDFEDAEIEHHIKSIFRNAIRDLMCGGPNHGTMEYMEQYGINPMTGYALTAKYIQDTQSHINNDKGPDINAHYAFYDNMYHTFKDEYKKAAKRIGLDHINHADFLMKENK